MAPLSNLTQSPPIKLLLIGDSSSGKTGALASLAVAGFHLRIIDTDKGISILVNYLSDPQSPYVKANPSAIENVEAVQVSDPLRSANGVLVPKKVKGWQRITKLLMDWEDGETKLGPVSSWGPNDILVIDSLSGLSSLALNFHLMLNGVLGTNRTQNESRRDMGATQNYLRSLLELLADEGVKCNVIVISHITTVTEAGGAPKVEEGKFEGPTPMGYPSAIGRALSPHVPRYFNNMLVVRAVQIGTRTVHKIFTTSQNLGAQIISAKTAAPLKVKPEYDISSGLADFFQDMRK